MAEIKKLFANIPTDLPEELFDSIINTPHLRIERIVSRGHASLEGFWYDQPVDEWVILLRGAARLRFADEPDAITLQPGDHVLIRAHVRHRVEWTDPTQDSVWLAVHGELTP